MEKHIELLGKKAKDVVTDFEGVVSSISFDLYGCIQAVITPPVDEKGEKHPGHWFDVTRVKVLDEIPIMPLPDFSRGYIADGKRGCAEKPISC